MLKRIVMVLMLALAAVTVAGCSSHPDDRGDVTGKDEHRRMN